METAINKITLRIGDRDVELTIDEAQELYRSLKGVVDTSQPQQHIVTIVHPPPRRGWPDFGPPPCW